MEGQKKVKGDHSLGMLFSSWEPRSLAFAHACHQMCSRSHSMNHETPSTYPLRLESRLLALLVFPVDNQKHRSLHEEF